MFAHLGNEWVIIANLFDSGFALLSKHFEASRVPDWLPNLPPTTGKAASYCS